MSPPPPNWTEGSPAFLHSHSFTSSRLKQLCLGEILNKEVKSNMMTLTERQWINVKAPEAEAGARVKCGVQCTGCTMVCVVALCYDQPSPGGRLALCAINRAAHHRKNIFSHRHSKDFQMWNKKISFLSSFMSCSIQFISQTRHGVSLSFGPHSQL